jgi:uncharacterized membrane protein YebE (DUF533 family)
MKRIAAVVIGGMVLSGAAWAQGTATPGIDKRQANQEQRIQEGVASGELTQREAKRLNRQQNRIDKMESRAKADGVVTQRERARLHRELDRSSRAIGREKHDRQTAGAR